MTQNATEFQPSEAQQAVVDRFQAKGYAISVRDACNRNETQRVQFYRWFRDPGFRAWWIEEIERYFAARLPEIYADLFDAALSKDDRPRAVAAHKLVLERFDRRFMPKSKQFVDVDAEATLTIEEAIKRFDAAVPGRVTNADSGPVGESDDESQSHEERPGRGETVPA